MKLLYYLAAIGKSNYVKKQEIFFENIRLISKQLKSPVDVVINMYTDDENFIQNVHNCSFIDKFYIHKRKGVLVEMWKTNPHNRVINNSYDYVLFILDDVSITQFDIYDLIRTKERFNVDIISPCIKNATHKWLMERFATNNSIRITNAVEIYCVIMKPETFVKYIDSHDIKNTWMWGHDFLLGFFGFTCAIYSDCKCLHYFSQSNKDFDTAAREQMKVFIQKHGFTSLKEIQRMYKPIKEVVVLKPLSITLIDGFRPKIN